MCCGNFLGMFFFNSFRVERKYKVEANVWNPSACDPFMCAVSKTRPSRYVLSPACPLVSYEGGRGARGIPVGRWRPGKDRKRLTAMAEGALDVA